MPSKYFLTWANLVTFSGILALGVAMWLRINGDHWIGLIVYAYAAATDLLDGQVARWQETRGGAGISAFGEKLDPIRDKMLVLILLTVSWKLSLVLLGLELISIFFSYVVRKKLDYHHITPISKLVTAAQLILIGIMLLDPEQLWSFFFSLFALTIVRASSYGYMIIKLKKTAQQ